MPEPASEEAPIEDLSALQKQLILAQVQILELEDIRDELQVQLTERSKLLSELQSIADRSVAELQSAHAAETTARQALARSGQENQEMHLKLRALRHDFETTSERLSQMLKLVERVEGTAAAQKARAETLEAELRKLKTSLSWRSTAPFRFLGRAFSRKTPPP